MKSTLRASAILLTRLLPEFLHAQESIDTSTITSAPIKIKRGSIFAGRPGKSMLMSLVIPGAGQIYNKSYLRVPFIWGAVGGLGYIVINNTRQYQCFRDAYISKIDNTPITLPGYCKPNIPFTTIELSDLERI